MVSGGTWGEWLSGCESGSWASPHLEYVLPSSVLLLLASKSEICLWKVRWKVRSVCGKLDES